jgi:hypothetical protein
MTRQEIEERFERINLHSVYGRQPAPPPSKPAFKQAGAKLPQLPKLPPKPVSLICTFILITHF